MVEKKILEVTITHNLDAEEKKDRLMVVKQKKRNKALYGNPDVNNWTPRIALDWSGNGATDIKVYKDICDQLNIVRRQKGQREIWTPLAQYKLFERMKNEGAAVIAAYKGALENPYRVLGWIEPGTHFENFEGLLCLRLTKPQLEDSSKSFLGNLAPNRCTVQRCEARAKGRLADWVLGRKRPPSVDLLHNKDVEVLVTNYMIAVMGCQCVWTGPHAFPGIDHVGWRDGNELFAQTTVSQDKSTVDQKIGDLLKHKSSDRKLHFFGPEKCGPERTAGFQYHAIEDVFKKMNDDNLLAGKWLINRMLAGEK